MRLFVRLVSVAALMLVFGCGGGDGGTESSPDCRNIGCVGDFNCQLNADDAYECLPSNQGGAYYVFSPDADILIVMPAPRSDQPVAHIKSFVG